MAYEFRPLPIANFSGGILDKYISSQTNMAETMDNFVILENTSLRSRKGTELDSLVDSQIPAGAQRISALINYKDDDALLVQSARKLYYRDPVNYATLQGPSGNDLLATGDATTQISTTEWNGMLLVGSDNYNPIQKIFRDTAGDLQLRQAGLPYLPSAPVITNAVGLDHSYIYAFNYRYSYSIGNRQFLDEGPVTYVQKVLADTPDVATVSITGILPLVNAVGENYDTAVVTIEVYRTLSGLNELYHIQSLSNVAAGITDSLADSIVQDAEILYTNGDIPDNDPPPAAKFVHTINNLTYYANYQEGGETFNSSIRQSQGLDPDSCPADFLGQVEQEIKGLSSVEGIPVVACTRHIYRIVGGFTRLGSGSMSYDRISDHAGCVSNSSMVQAEQNLYWAGNDGFYVTDGSFVRKISDHINETYKTYLSTLNGLTSKIKGVYDEENRLIHWTFSKDVEGVTQDCDIIITCDLRHGVSSKMTFHTWSGGDSFFPTSLVVFNKELHRADAKGYVLVFRDNQLNDPKIDPSIPVSDWSDEAIIWDYISPAFNFGTDHVRKVANKILISCKNVTNASISIQAINDDGRSIRTITPIRWRKNFTWGDEEFSWGDPAFVWDVGGLIEEDRRFPRKGYRFNRLQIRITNALINIINSDTYGEVTTDLSAKSATLNDSSSVDWLTDSVDYFISFSSNNFTTTHKILTRTPDTITYEDPSGAIMDNANQTWQITGHRKNEIINLNSYSISWAMATRSHSDFSSSSSTGSLA